MAFCLLTRRGGDPNIMGVPPMMRQFKAGRRRIKPHHLRAAVWVIAIMFFCGLVAYVRHEGQVREDQFCELTLHGHSEKVKRIEGTVEFLETPNSDLPQSLIDLKSYIRNISLPQSKKEVFQEQKDIPEVCVE